MPSGGVSPSGGGVSTVTAADTSIVVGGTTKLPTVATNTLDVIAVDHPPAAAVPMNGQKVTGIANGTAASDAAAFGQIPTTGQLLAVKSYAPAALATYARNAAAVVALDTTNLTVTPTIPASGNALVYLEASAISGAAGTLAWAVLNHSGGAQLGNTVEITSDSGTTDRYSAMFVLTGLTPGPLGIDWAAGCSAGTGNTYAMGATGAANGANVGPAVMIVWAA